MIDASSLFSKRNNIFIIAKKMFIQQQNFLFSCHPRRRNDTQRCSILRHKYKVLTKSKKLHQSIQVIFPLFISLLFSFFVAFLVLCTPLRLHFHAPILQFYQTGYRITNLLEHSWLAPASTFDARPLLLIAFFQYFFSTCGFLFFLRRRAFPGGFLTACILRAIGVLAWWSLFLLRAMLLQPMRLLLNLRIRKEV